MKLLDSARSRSVLLFAFTAVALTGCGFNRSAINSDMTDERIERIVRGKLEPLEGIQEKAIKASTLSEMYRWHGINVAPWNASTSQLRIPLHPKSWYLMKPFSSHDTVVQFGDDGRINSVSRQRRLYPEHWSVPRCWADRVGVPIPGPNGDIVVDDWAWIDDSELDPWNESSEVRELRTQVRLALSTHRTGEFKVDRSKRFINVLVAVPGLERGTEYSIVLESDTEFLITAQGDAEVHPCDWAGSYLPPNDLGLDRIPENETRFCLRLIVAPHRGTEFAVSLQREATP